MVASRLMSIAVGVVVVLSACGGSEDKGKTPSRARASCAADSECVVTDRSHCCAPCLEAPRAIPALAFEQQKNKCAAVECGAASDRIECPKVESKDGFVAKCNDGTCAAVKR